MYLYKYGFNNIIPQGNHNREKNITVIKNENVNAKGCPNYGASLLCLCQFTY